MSHPNFIKIKRVVIERAPCEIVNPFLGLGIREMARETKLDPGYLSRVKSGKLAITPERFQELVDASERISNREGTL